MIPAEYTEIRFEVGDTIKVTLVSYLGDGDFHVLARVGVEDRYFGESCFRVTHERYDGYDVYDGIDAILG